MRKVTEKIVRAFKRGESLTVGNTRTDGNNIYLHGNCIARKCQNGDIQISTCGWNTATTRERLNGLIASCNWNERVYQEKGVLYYRYEPWDGGWAYIPGVKDFPK